MITTTFSLPIKGEIRPVTANLFVYREGEPMETDTSHIAPYSWTEFCIVMNDTDTYSISIDERSGEIATLLYAMDDDSPEERAYGLTLTGILMNAITAIYRDATRQIPAELLYDEFDDDEIVI